MTYRMHEILGEDFDVIVYTNGGTYHKVKIENIDNGETVKIKKFHSRAKAMAYAEKEARELNS